MAKRREDAEADPMPERDDDGVPVALRIAAAEHAVSRSGGAAPLDDEWWALRGVGTPVEQLAHLLVAVERLDAVEVYERAVSRLHDQRFDPEAVAARRRRLST